MLWLILLRKTLDEGSFGCGIFVLLQKTFDTGDNKFLLHQLEYYEIRVACNEWLKSCFSDRKHFVSVNVCDYDNASKL